MRSANRRSGRQRTPRIRAALFALALGVAAPRAALAASTLRVATLVPKASSWGKILRTWEKAVSERTHGEVTLDVYYNGVHGMEDAMVAKMRTGQLDGAVVSSVGLADIYKDVLVLQLPGVLVDWATLDRAREALSPELERGFASAGFSLLSWADVGLVRPYSEGIEVRKPPDMKTAHPLVYRDDPILPVLFQTVGGVVPTPLDVGEVLPALRTGSVNVVLAPGLAVEQLQWAPHLDHVTNWVMVSVIGGTIFRSAALDALPTDVRGTFLDIQKRVGALQSREVRQDDIDAYGRVSKKMQRVSLSPAERDAWSGLARETVRRLSLSTFPRNLVEKVTRIAEAAGTGASG
jgi:TRAP-type C4-dicarboxylate transport system substrate-binding protein